MAALRHLAPSFQQGDSSGSSSTKNISSGGDGDSGGGSEEGAGGGDGNDTWNKRRRAAGTISANACNSCRQARQKCDGLKPDACSRCRHRKQSCHYEPHTKVHKDDLIKELERSRAEKSQLEITNKEEKEHCSRLDDQNKNLRQSSDWQRIILETIGSNGHDREIIKRLRSGETHQSIADWLQKINPEFAALDLEPSTHRNLTEVVKVFEDQCYEHDGLQRSGHPPASQVKWTKVTRDERLLGHLFDLYFTWVHPVHMVFSELDFRREFRNGLHTYCASSLVNAICAMACHLLETESRPEMSLIDVGRGHDAATLRQGFLEEAKKEIPSDPLPSMTSTQAFAVMYLVELSSGKARSATAYLRSAIDGIRSIDTGQQSEEAKEITFWGIKVLITFCVGTTYQKFHAPPLDYELTLFNHVHMDRDNEVWRFYRKADDQDMPTRPNFAIKTAAYQADLFRIIEDSIQTYCGRKGPVNAKVANEIFKQYRNWFEDLPPEFKRIDEVEDPLPQVFNLHIQYHTAVMQHLDPLIESGHFMGSDLAEMHRLTAWHAMSGIEILVASKNIYTSRYSLPIDTFCVVLLCDGFMKHSQNPPMATEAFKHSLNILQQTRSGFALCGPLQELLRQRAQIFGIGIPADMREVADSFNHYGLDDFLDACTRLSYVQPYDQFLYHIDPQIATEWKDEWSKANTGDAGSQMANRGQLSASRRPSTPGKMNIESLLND